MRKTKVLAAFCLAALVAVGCQSIPDETVGTTSTGPSNPPPAPAPAPTSAAPVAVTTPSIEVAPDAEFDKAKAQSGFADVKKLGKNPFAGDQEATKQGAELYQTNCASCHGPAGLGDGPAGLALNPKPRNLTATAEYKLGKGDLGIYRTVKYGSDGTGMTPWEGRMTDEECWKVTNYVRCLQK